MTTTLDRSLEGVPGDPTTAAGHPAEPVAPQVPAQSTTEPVIEPDAEPCTLPCENRSPEQPTAAFLLTCLFAEHGNPNLGATATPVYVQNLLRRHLTSETHHADLLSWQDRIGEEGECWYRWDRARELVQAHFPKLYQADPVPNHRIALAFGQLPPPPKRLTLPPLD